MILIRFLKKLFENPLRRPANCKYFLVPVNDTAETISIPTCLQTFNKNFLEGADISPTTNQIRKFFHNWLMKLTKDHDSLKDVMRILDAHGKKVMQKHYLFVEPDDDAALAKMLVEKVIGETVKWPTKEEAEAELASLEGFLSKKMAEPEMKSESGEGGEEAEEDPDDEPLESWRYGSLFGVREVGELALLPLPDESNEDSTNNRPLENSTVNDASEGKDGGANKEEKKPKKEKKERNAQKEKKEKGEKKRAKREHENDEEEGVAPVPSYDYATEQKLYDYNSPQYAYVKTATSKKQSVDPMVHEDVWAAVQKWQNANRKGSTDRPGKNTWYENLRCLFIDEGKLTTFSCESVCRNSARTRQAAEIKKRADVN